MTINEKDMSKISEVAEEPIKVDDKDAVSALLPPPVVDESIADAGQKKGKIDSADLLKVSGGVRKTKVVETKDSKFILVPEHCVEFDTIEEANKKIEEYEKQRFCCGYLSAPKVIKNTKA